jgi:hypothetical protein
LNTSEWLKKYLEKVEQSSEEGREAVEFVRQHRIKIGIKRARKSVGAFWTLGRGFYLNAHHYTKESILADNPRAITIFVHEVRHLQQGPLTALSIYGELDAWQLEFRLLKKMRGAALHPILEELLTLPLNFERDNLQRAQNLMSRFAGKGYGAWILPLYPIPKEIKYWLTRNLRNYKFNRFF